MQDLASHQGIAHKADIAPVLARLGIAGDAARGVGDDCAIIPDGDGFLLFAIEGFLDAFVAADPFFAGYCGVMVNASDVFSTGGRPLAVVDAVWSHGFDNAAELLDGLAFGARTYGIPILGGHTNTRNETSHLAVAILGRAQNPLRSTTACPGDVLLAAIDLRGRVRTPAPWWDASSEAARRGEGARLREDLELLPRLAEAGLVRACKDISMGGVMGTAIMLAESSGVGIAIEGDAVPRPAGIDRDLWLTCFPSFGFLLAVAPYNADAVARRFTDRGIACAAIGSCDKTRSVQIDGACVWDLAASPLIGVGT